jgi:uncharacterized membrane protein
LNNQNQEKGRDMELVKFIHDFTIIGAFIVLALLPRLVVALAEAKANARKQAEERI